MGGSTVMSPPPAMPPLPRGVGVGGSMSLSSHHTVHAQPVHTLSQAQLAYPQAQQYDYPASLTHAHALQLQHQQGLPGVPSVQPLPAYETPSAFAGPSPPSSAPLNLRSSTSVSGTSTSAYAHVHHPHAHALAYPHAGAVIGMHPQASASGSALSVEAPGSGARSPLERAVERVQAHLAALQERMETLEARVGGGSPYGSHASFGGAAAPGVAPGIGAYGPPARTSPRGSPFGSHYAHAYGLSGGGGSDMGGSLWRRLADFDGAEYFGWTHMGLWSVTLVPLARLTRFLFRVLAFLLVRRGRERERGRRADVPGMGGSGALPVPGDDEGMSPGLVVLRRLLLDASFVLVVAAIARAGWRRSGMRRREVLRALKGVWGAVVGPGTATGRVLIDRAV